MQPVWIYVIKKRERMTMKNRAYVILPFTNKSGLHCKVKRIFFLMCQIKMYWLNVSNSFFFACQNWTSACGRIREAKTIFLLADKGREGIIIVTFWVAIKSCDPWFPKIIVYDVDFVLVLNTNSILYINSTRRKLKMLPLWAVVRYMQVKIICNVP